MIYCISFVSIPCRRIECVEANSGSVTSPRSITTPIEIDVEDEGEDGESVDSIRRACMTSARNKSSSIPSIKIHCEEKGDEDDGDVDEDEKLDEKGLDDDNAEFEFIDRLAPSDDCNVNNELKS